MANEECESKDLDKMMVLKTEPEEVNEIEVEPMEIVQVKMEPETHLDMFDVNEEQLPFVSVGILEKELTKQEHNGERLNKPSSSRDEMLIEIVKSKPELYDLTSPLYNNIIVKRRIWDEINKQLGCEGNKERWESLRSQFRKVNRKYEKSGQAATSTVKWKYEEQMGFLRSFSKDRSRICSMPSNEADIFETTVDDMEEIDDENESITLHVPEKSPVNKITSSSAMSGKTYDQVRPRKRKQQPTPSASSTLMNYLLENEQSADPIDTFFQSMASTVKKFNSKHQLLAKSKVFAIITEIEAQYINQDYTPSVSPALLSSSSVQNPASLHLLETNERLSAMLDQGNCDFYAL